MRIAALLPHVEIYGGVRRYIEIGNELIKRGHTFVLFTPKGEKPQWLDFIGTSQPHETLELEEFDIGICSEYSLLDRFEETRARAKFFYFLLEGHKKEREVARRDYRFLGNSEGICRRMERKYGVRCLRAPGGINPSIFYPCPREQRKSSAQTTSGEFRILCYGRVYKKRKGIQHVIKAVEKIQRRFPRIRLIFFDSPVGEDKRDARALIKTSVPHDFYLNLPQSKMAWLFSRADIFVSAERRAGWANTAAEAMACRLPVVCTTSGAHDFAVHGETALVIPFAHSFFLRRQIKKLIMSEELRDRLSQAGYEKIQEFTWAALAERLESLFSLALSNRIKKQ